MSNEKTEQIINGSSISVKNYFKDLRKIEQIGNEEQTLLAIKAKNGDKEATDKLIKCNLRFVLSIAKEYQSKYVDIEDLINEGNIGLIKAVEKFDHTKGFKFISYAVWWIRQSIMQYIYENGHIIRLPINKINVIGKIQKVMDEFHQKFDRDPTSQEIKEMTEFSNEEIKSSYTDNSRCLSLDKKVNEDSDSELIDLIPSDHINDIEDKMNGESLKSELNGVLDSLTDRESKILNCYFGLNGFQEMSLKEIGDTMNLTNERVRQIKELALKKMRMYGKSSKLREFLNCKLS